MYVYNVNSFVNITLLIITIIVDPCNTKFGLYPSSTHLPGCDIVHLQNPLVNDEASLTAKEIVWLVFIVSC